MNYMERAMAPAEEAHREKIMRETWGHLAPTKNKTYKGRVVYAIGCYSDDHLNPTPLVCEFGGLDDSPWFFETLQDFLWEQKFEAGCVYEFIGTFRNYKFKGEVKLLLDTN